MSALNSGTGTFVIELHAILRTRPTIIRRPAAVPAVADPPERLGPKKTTMWYKSHCEVGVRRQVGDRKQCFQFGHSNQSKEFLMDLGQQACQRLSAGEDEPSVKSWVMDTLATL